MLAKTINITLASILIAIITGYSVFADDIPKIRELPSNPAPVNNQFLKNDRDNIFKTKEITRKLENNLSVTDNSQIPTLKSGISQLKATVGKSQYVKFDQPVKRLSLTDPSFADLVLVSPKEILINGLKNGETSLLIWGESAKDPVIFDLVIQNNTTNFYTFLKEAKKIAPNEAIKIELVDSGNSVESAGGSVDLKSDGGKTSATEIPKGKQRIMITGKFSSTYIKEKVLALATSYGYSVINMSESLTPQVMITLKVVEINRTRLKKKVSEYSNGTSVDTFMKNKFGREAWAEQDIKAQYPIQDIYINPDGTAVPYTTSYQYLSSGQTKRVTGNEAIQYLASLLGEGQKSIYTQTSNDMENGFTFWRWSYDKGGENSQVAQSINMAENEGVANILAEPKLMAITGQKATFHSGDQVPQIRGRDEFGGLKIEQIDTGIDVSFTPTILEDSGRILLDIHPKISTASIASNATIEGFPIYLINSRSTDTKVELADNETIVIGGLIQKKANSQKSKVPYVGNVPILGNILGLLNFASNIGPVNFGGKTNFTDKLGNLGILSNNYSFTQDDTELMIFVTPTIVKPDAVVNGV